MSCVRHTHYSDGSLWYCRVQVQGRLSCCRSEQPEDAHKENQVYMYVSSIVRTGVCYYTKYMMHQVCTVGDDASSRMCGSSCSCRGKYDVRCTRTSVPVRILPHSTLLVELFQFLVDARCSWMRCLTFSSSISAISEARCCVAYA